MENSRQKSHKLFDACYTLITQPENMRGIDNLKENINAYGRLEYVEGYLAAALSDSERDFKFSTLLDAITTREDLILFTEEFVSNMEKIIEKNVKRKQSLLAGTLQILMILQHHINKKDNAYHLN